MGLERRTARGGRDSIDHTPGGHDDLANAAAGVLVSLDLDRRPALVQLRDVLNDGAALPLPTRSRYVVAIMWADKRGQSAVIYAARMPIDLVPRCCCLITMSDRFIAAFSRRLTRAFAISRRNVARKAQSHLSRANWRAMRWRRA